MIPVCADRYNMAEPPSSDDDEDKDDNDNDNRDNNGNGGEDSKSEVHGEFFLRFLHHTLHQFSEIGSNSP